MTLLAVLLVFLIGLLIGTVGIGGFLVVPVLVFLEGRSPRDAVIAATVCFVGSGLVSLWVWRRERRVAPGGSRPFLLTAAPGALAGALLLKVIGGAAIAILIAGVVGLAGIAELFGRPRAAARRAHRLRAALDGFVTGMGSALTGTSGPLIAMPLLARSGLPTLERIRIGQVAQLPIAATAAAVFIAAGDIAWTVAAISALSLALGGLVGMRLGLSIAPAALSRIAGILMLLTACSMVASHWL
jgi:uncharacterized protein